MFLWGDRYSRLSQNELPLIDSISTCQSIEIGQLDVQGPSQWFNEYNFLCPSCSCTNSKEKSTPVHSKDIALF